MFKFLGVALALYAIHAVRSGEVYAKSRMSGRVVSRQESPEYFWVIIAIYTGLAVALLFVF